LVKARISAAELGYYITETKQEEREVKRQTSKGRKGKNASQQVKTTTITPVLSLPKGETWHSFFGNEDADRGMGINFCDFIYFACLYRCANCHTILFKPLKCDKCMCVAYCSLECQKQHYKIHKKYCKKIRLFMIY